MRILALVGSELRENRSCRKGKGFLALSISQELGDPKCALN